MNLSVNKTVHPNQTVSWFYPFVFNGKEKDYESGFHYYGARYYWSETLTGWLSIDPLADKYPNISPYNYCIWNPILFVDPDGEEKLIYYNLNIPHQSNFTGKDARPVKLSGDHFEWQSPIVEPLSKLPVA